MTTDPFDLLRDQLVDAAGRAAMPARRRRWTRRRPLLVLVGALAISGTATAAVLSLQGEPSPPLSGRLGGPSPASSYRITITPDLRAGGVGWCSTVALRHGSRPSAAGTGCGGAAGRRARQIMGGALAVPGHTLIYAITDAQVAAVRLADGRVIRTRADAGLPFGWRASVVLGPKGGRSDDVSDMSRLAFLDAHGAPLAEDPRRLQSPEPLTTRPVDARRPAPARCVIVHDDLGALRPVSQRVVTGPLRPAQHLNGRPFRSCAEAQFDTGRGLLRAAVLVDAADPTRPPAALPPGSGLAARRAGRAWLVVAGGRGPAERAALLARLRTTD
jgi:hypothetical protein